MLGEDLGAVVLDLPGLLPRGGSICLRNVGSTLGPKSCTTWPEVLHGRSEAEF